MPRVFFRCTDCLSVVAADLEHVPSYHADRAECGCGGKLDVMGEVDGRSLVNRHLGCPCDSRCTGATGPSCDCKCGGANHGTNRLVAFVTNAGNVPRITPPDPDKSARIAAEFRAARDAASARIQARYGDLFAAKLRGEWISEWSRYMEGDRLRSAFREASHAKSHAGRLKKLAAILPEVTVNA